MKAGDEVNWTCPVNGECSGEVIVPEKEGTSFSLVAVTKMGAGENLAASCQVVAVSGTVLEKAGK